MNIVDDLLPFREREQSLNLHELLILSFDKWSSSTSIPMRLINIQLCVKLKGRVGQENFEENPKRKSSNKHQNKTRKGSKKTCFRSPAWKVFVERNKRSGVEEEAKTLPTNKHSYIFNKPTCLQIHARSYVHCDILFLELRWRAAHNVRLSSSLALHLVLSLSLSLRCIFKIICFVSNLVYCLSFPNNKYSSSLFI